MSTAVQEWPARAGTRNGGIPARLAVIRWAWRMFRREWRQQFLVLALVVIAVAATFIGAAVATDTPPVPNAGFGTATDMAQFAAPDPHLAAQIATLRRHFGRMDVIENQSLSFSGSVNTYDLRAQDPRGAFGQPMLSLLSGAYPARSGQVAVTGGVASAFGLRIGGVWRQGGVARRVVGIVENPQNLLDQFALVPPAQLPAPSQVTVLFDAPGVAVTGNNELSGLPSLGAGVQTTTSVVQNNVVSPQALSIAAATLGMILIALVAIGGFTVLAQRRLRAIGMFASLGATDSHIRLVVRANGVAVGVVGAVAGAAVGLAGWLAYRPALENSAHHVIGTFQLPWLVIVVAMVLAISATYFAASRPARAMARIPVLAALSGRPAAPHRVRRSAIPGLAVLGAGFALVTIAGSATGAVSSSKVTALALVIGLLALAVSIVLLAPVCLALLALLARPVPIAARLALRDLSRYRARSGSALGAISIAVLIAVVICVQVAARYANVLDYVGPNLAANQLVLYAPPVAGSTSGPGPQGGGLAPGTDLGYTRRELASLTATADRMAAGLRSRGPIQLDMPNASLQRAVPGRNWNGNIFVATPALLHAFGIRASQIDPAADVLTARPGLSGLSEMQLTFGNYGQSGGGPNNAGTSQSFPCPRSDCLASPVIQEIGSLPAGTSAPNTLFTEHAIKTLHLAGGISLLGWLIQTPQPLTPSQISNAQQEASAVPGMSIETRSNLPSSAEILSAATLFGVLLALVILAMTIGLIRSESASDLRTLAATGASSSMRRSLTAVTAGVVALVGAVLGAAAGCIGCIAYARSNSLDGLSTLSNVPVRYLLIIVLGMPAIATVGAWLLAGREQRGMGRQPLE
jgi:putative ABC transport system permease protein